MLFSESKWLLKSLYSADNSSYVPNIKQLMLPNKLIETGTMLIRRKRHRQRLKFASMRFVFSVKSLKPS